MPLKFNKNSKNKNHKNKNSKNKNHKNKNSKKRVKRGGTIELLKTHAFDNLDQLKPTILKTLQELKMKADIDIGIEDILFMKTQSDYLVICAKNHLFLFQIRFELNDISILYRNKQILKIASSYGVSTNTITNVELNKDKLITVTYTGNANKSYELFELDVVNNILRGINSPIKTQMFKESEIMLVKLNSKIYVIVVNDNSIIVYQGETKLVSFEYKDTNYQTKVVRYDKNYLVHLVLNKKLNRYEFLIFNVSKFLQDKESYDYYNYDAANDHTNQVFNFSIVLFNKTLYMLLSLDKGESYKEPGLLILEYDLETQEMAPGTIGNQDMIPLLETKTEMLEFNDKLIALLIDFGSYYLLFIMDFPFIETKQPSWKAYKINKSNLVLNTLCIISLQKNRLDSVITVLNQLNEKKMYTMVHHAVKC